MINRPLEFYEALHSNNNIVLVSFIEAALTKKEIDQAWYYTQLRHPYLRMDLDTDDALPYKLRFVERRPSKSIPADQFHLEIGPLTEETWQSTLQEMTNQPRADCPKLWYIRLRSNPRQTQHQLYIMINHCGSDGIGVFAILDTFLDFLGKVLSKDPIPKVESLEFVNIQARVPANAVEIPTFQNTEPGLPALKPQSMFDPDDPAKVSAVWFALDQRKTTQLRTACKGHDVTLQAAVTCAEMLAVAINSLVATPLPHHMVICAPVNLRPYVTPPISNEQSVCGSSAVFWEQDLRADMSLWSLTHETTRGLKAALGSKYPLKFRYDIQSQPNVMTAGLPAATFMASSVGRTPIRGEYHGFKLHGVKIIAGAYDSCRVSSAGMVAHAYTVQDSFTVTFGYTDPSFSHEWAAKFARIMETFLTILAGGDEGEQSVERFIAQTSA
jgi:hypothetical protein